MKPEIDLFEKFFSERESLDYLRILTETVEWKQKTIRIFGKDILEPRLTAWYGDPHAVYTYSATRMQPLPWTKPLLEIRQRVEKACTSTFNSVLLNFYRNHLDSMGLHSDDEKELGPQPIIASVSFGAPRKFILKHRLKKLPLQSYRLDSGTLLVMRGNTQKFWKHGVPKEKEVYGPRVNLTFRRIFPLASRGFS